MFSFNAYADCYKEYLKEASTNNFEKAIKICTPLAQNGDVWSQEILGGIYYRIENYKEAFNWRKKAAEQGNTAAQNNMGFMYEKGRGVLKDYKASASWYQKAADAGSATAQVNLGSYYCYGTGVDKDLAMSKTLLLKAYESGDLSANQLDWVERIWERCELANY